MHVNACESPVGEWAGKVGDHENKPRLIFKEDGTGILIPDTKPDLEELFYWKTIAPIKASTVGLTSRKNETSVLEIKIATTEGLIDYVLCTKDQILGQRFYDNSINNSVEYFIYIKK